MASITFPRVEFSIFKVILCWFWALALNMVATLKTRANEKRFRVWVKRKLIIDYNLIISELI